MNDVIDETKDANARSDECANVLVDNIDISNNFMINNITFKLSKLSTYKMYLESIKLISMVSRCSMVHNERYITQVLKSNLFYPITIHISNDENGSNSAKIGELVGYFEIYLLPHLGRTFDGRIERVVIHPKYRDIGLCQKMMTLGIEICKNNLKCNRIDLYAETDLAIHIYTKLGFTQVDTNVYRLTLI